MTLQSQAMLRVAAVCGVAGSMASGQATAQPPDPGTPTAVIIVVPDAIPEPSDRRFLGGREQIGQIRLHQGGEGFGGAATLIVLDAARMTPHSLRVALLTTQAFRDGDLLRSDRIFAIPDLPATDAARSGAAGFARLLGDFRSGRQRGNLRGVGPVEWMRFDDLDEMLMRAGAAGG